MHKNITIRFADEEDIETIGFLAQQIWPVAYKEILSADQLNYMLSLMYSPSSLRKQMSEQNHIFLIVEDNMQGDEEAVGFASYSVTDEAGIYKLHKLYVLPNQQGKGVGKFIVDFVVDQVKANDASALRLTVNRNNRAKYFYEKLGFKIIGEIDLDIGDNFFMNDYLMELQLS